MVLEAYELILTWCELTSSQDEFLPHLYYRTNRAALMNINKNEEMTLTSCEVSFGSTEPINCEYPSSSQALDSAPVQGTIRHLISCI